MYGLWIPIGEGGAVLMCWAGQRVLFRPCIELGRLVAVGSGSWEGSEGGGGLAGYCGWERRDYQQGGCLYVCVCRGWRRGPCCLWVCAGSAAAVAGPLMGGRVEVVCCGLAAAGGQQRW